jgi:hypothetical protein
MAASILNSPQALEMGVYVVRAFVHLRELLSSNGNWLGASRSSRRDSIKSSPSTICPSPPASAPALGL